MTEKEAMEYIEEAGSLGSVYGLDSIRELLNRLGNPQKELQFVHIAGTNGKGSVLCFLSAILKDGGYRVGRYLSPTIFQYRERIQVQEKPISVKAMCSHLETIRQAVSEMIEEGKAQPTAFEIETAMAFLYFLEKKCDIVVLETGLGGETDATNIIENTIAAVFASISMDHMGILGDTPEKIAGQKAGIIKNNCYVITAKQTEEVEQVLRERAEKMGCPFVTADSARAAGIHYGIERQWFSYGDYKKAEITMAGKYQIANSVLALEVIRVLGEKGFPVAPAKVLSGLKRAQWQGRFQVVAKAPLFIVDGAHNEDAAVKLADSVRFYFTKRKIIFIMGILKDKEYEKIVQKTAMLAEHIITVTPPHNSRALPAYELAQTVSRYHNSVTAADSLMEAVEMGYLLSDKDSVILAFGSLSYLGELIGIVENRQNLRSDSHGKPKEN